MSLSVRVITCLNGETKKWVSWAFVSPLCKHCHVLVLRQETAPVLGFSALGEPHFGVWAAGFFLCPQEW